MALHITPGVPGPSSNCIICNIPKKVDVIDMDEYGVPKALPYAYTIYSVPFLLNDYQTLICIYCPNCGIQYHRSSVGLEY